MASKKEVKAQIFLLARFKTGKEKFGKYPSYYSTNLVILTSKPTPDCTNFSSHACGQVKMT